MKKRIFFGFLAIILLIPLLMWIAWLLTPNTKLVVAIIDKTVLSPQGQEHISLNWVLNHKKYTKTSTKAYDVGHDYFGFFPLKNEKYKLKGLERFSESKLSQLSSDADLAYFTDTYGIYNNEWFKKGDVNERSGMLYGGLSYNDVEFMQLMKEKHKLIIAEFNTIGSPTGYNNRRQFEKMFKLKWTGWTARYFANLNQRTNPELPAWLISNYKKSHDNVWPFKKSGIAFVNNVDEVVILEEDTHLTESMPHIITSKNNNYSLPETMKYPFWFDIMVPDTSVNKIISSFKLDLNENGKKELKANGIPLEFPAVTAHIGNDYQFFYFSGDFADNPVGLQSSYFSGITFFKGFFYDERNITERSSFFWNFYKPLLTNILSDYSENQSR